MNEVQRQQHPRWSAGEWVDFGKKVVHQCVEDDLLGQSAQLSFYLLLGLFPALLCLTALVGMLPLDNIIQQFMEYLQTVLPAESLGLVQDYIKQVRTGSGGGILSLGMVGALWAASSGVVALMDALNVVYDVKESRPMWKARLIAVGMTIAIGFSVILFLFLIILGGRVSQWIAQWVGYGDLFVTFWALVQWPLVFLGMLLAVNTTYFFAPNTRGEWTWFSAGAVVAVVLWLAASLGFKLYVENFNSYNAAYGSLAGVIVLMLWLYISGAALLLGAEINSEFLKAGAPSYASRMPVNGGDQPQGDSTGTSSRRAEG